MAEKYYVIYPSGEIKLEEIKRSEMLDRMHEIIGCDFVEQVRTIIPGVCMIVDESGRVKDPPQKHNPLASCFYMGWLQGYDDIVGPAIFVSLQPVGPYDELDWFPLTQLQKMALSIALDMDLPEDNT